jgi:hypothetical protein
MNSVNSVFQPTGKETHKAFHRGGWLLAFVCALTSLAFAGCATSKGRVVSKRDPSFEGKLQRVLIICPDRQTSASLGNQFASRFLKQLTNSLTQSGVPAASVDVEKEALDNRALVEKAANHFRAGQMLDWSIAGINTMSTVRQTMPGDIPSFRSSTSVALEFGMYDVWVNRVVWRARFTFQMSPSPEAVADQLVEELVAAKLLVQQSPQQNR